LNSAAAQGKISAVNDARPHTTPIITAQTQLCAVIGNPVSHSLSPVMHNAAYRAAGLDYVYVAFRVVDVAGCLAGMRALEGFRGMSVTIPHKEAVMPYLDEISPLARQIGCVNTITRDGGRLLGSNTDGIGTLRAFQLAGLPYEGKRVLFLGTGGAVRAVAFAFAAEAAPERITLLGRTPANVARLADDLRAQTQAAIADGSLATELPAVLAEHDIIINGTPLGMHPAAVEATPVPAALLEARHVVFDMVYRPQKTRLLREAEAAGCAILPGLEMLVCQGELQFQNWTGQAPPAGVMRAALLQALGA